MKHLTTLPLILILALFLSACGGGAETSAAGDNTLNVVTTIGQIGDAARIVGGDHVTVTSLMGPGIDPHLYTASESDVSKLTEADVILYNGLFLEAQMADVLRQIGERKTAVAVAEAIPADKLLASPDYADAYDPHVWFDVELWSVVVTAVRDTLMQADPDNAAAYEANAAAYLAELAELHSYVQAQADRVPPQQRVLITAHDAFSYFGRAYGFEVMGLQGISTQSEASTADVQNLAELHRRQPDSRHLHRILRAGAHHRSGAGRRRRPGSPGRHRRLSLLRRHGQRRHPGRQLHRHGAA
jgi:manganese/zinc/iron transport system substrate-binding protein